MLRCMGIFSVLLMTAANVRAQCERPDVGENRILTDESNNQTFTNGANLEYKCATGYVPVRSSASRTITCIGTEWSEIQLQCKRRPCGNPGEITNGKYLMPDGILFGATIIAECNEGYQLLGQTTRNCREFGWDGRAPECIVVKCEKPRQIDFGTFDPVEEYYAYGETVTYSCRRDLDLIGSSVITCMSDGTFQPPPPQCRSVICDSPQISNARRIEGKSPPYKYKQFARYQCNKGYRMEGSDFLICTENGWDPPSQCAAITCPKPPAINNTEYATLKELYEYGETVTYSCNEGFRVTQPSTISCTDEGTFGPAPQCLEAICDEPQIKNGMVINGKLKSYKYKSRVQVQCNKGYKMEGSDYLTCEEMGWNPPPPQCNIFTDQSTQTTVIVIVIILIILVVAVCAFVCCKKNIKYKEHKAASIPENCSLVKMLPSNPPTEETQPQRTEDPIQTEKN